MKFKVGDKDFIVILADTDQKRSIGLSKLGSMPKGKGLLMKFDPPQDVAVRMSDMKFPLDLIFIADRKVIKVVNAKAGARDIVINRLSDYVLEVNRREADSIDKGDAADFVGEKLEDGTVSIAPGGVMLDGVRHVLDENGQNQMNLLGSERIFSRKATEKLFELAKSGEMKKLGKFLVAEINKQDTQEAEYAEN